jgi:NADPH2:quinone reductase
VRDPLERRCNAELLFGLIADGTLRLEINQRYPLAEAVAAHTDLIQRRTMGSSIFVV